MAIAPDFVPGWREKLQALADTLWFYWDDYVFSRWAGSQGLPITDVPQAVFTSPNPPRRRRAGWRYYYEARNAVWFARMTLNPWHRRYFVALWFFEFVIAFGLRDRKFRWAWRGFWDGVRGVKGRTVQPIAKPEHYKLDMRGSAT
jgi:GT2 family glycosyltransferase